MMDAACESNRSPIAWNAALATSGRGDEVAGVEGAGGAGAEGAGADGT